MANLIGQQLGQYQIISLLGEGGMASVYRARQVNFNREVAIKVIKTGLQSGDFFRRFEREAQIVANLSHPHILKVFDYGQHEDTVYIVMELMTGGSLAQLIERERLPLDRVARLLSQIADALDYAHEQGIVHRDLKPQNVLLDGRGNAILTDFGIVKVLTGNATNLTQTGTAMGTPSYMAPEQWTGDHPLDARTDTYALGVTLYEMLAGRLPFTGDTPAQLLYQHLQRTPPSILTSRPDLPPVVEAVVNRSLGKTPEERFQSAGELSRAFTAALQGQPIPPADPTKLNAPTPAMGSAPGNQATVAATAPVMAQGSGTPNTIITPVPSATRRSPIVPIMIGAIALLIIAIILVVINQQGATAAQEQTGTSTQQTAIAAGQTVTAIAQALSGTETAVMIALSATAAPTLTETPSPTPFDPAGTVTGVFLTSQAEIQQQTAAAATQFANATATEVTRNERATQTELAIIAQATQTATQWTKTPTNTPTATFTPSNTPTPTFTPTNTATPTPTFTPSNTPTATFTPTEDPNRPIQFGSEGKGEGQFEDPRALAVDNRGFIYVADFDGGRIQKFDEDGNFQRAYFVQGRNGNNIILAMVADGEGNLYVAIAGNGVTRLNTDTGEVDNSFALAGRFSFDSLTMRSDSVFVGFDSDTIVFFNRNGQVLKQIEEMIETVTDSAALSGEIALDGQGNIYAITTFEESVFRFDAEGKFRDRFGKEGRGVGEFFGSLSGIVVGKDGRIYVGDFGGIKIFSAEGDYLGILNLPIGNAVREMEFTREGRLFITMSGGSVLRLYP